MSTGNHELYVANTARREHEQTVPMFHDSYITSNLDYIDPATGKRVPQAPQRAGSCRREKSTRFLRPQDGQGRIRLSGIVVPPPFSPSNRLGGGAIPGSAVITSEETDEGDRG